MTTFSFSLIVMISKSNAFIDFPIELERAFAHKREEKKNCVEIVGSVVIQAHTFCSHILGRNGA